MDVLGYVRAGTDLIAYIDTLDPAEALGEAKHVGASIDSMLQMVAQQRATLAEASEAVTVMAYVLAMLVRRYGDVTDAAVTDPDCVSAVHSCQLAARMLAASRG